MALAICEKPQWLQNSIPQNDEVTVRQTKRALNIAIPLVTACYAIFGIMGCAALATSTLDIWGQLPMSAPHWVVNLLLILLFIQMLGIYQVSCVRRCGCAVMLWHVVTHKICHTVEHKSCKCIPLVIKYEGTLETMRMSML